MDRSCLIVRPYASPVFSDIFFFLKYDLNDSARFPWSFGSSFITYPLNNNGAAGILPVYDLIEEILLFSTAFMQVNAGSLNALMSKNIGQKRNVITLFYKFFCE